MSEHASQEYIEQGGEHFLLPAAQLSQEVSLKLDIPCFKIMRISQFFPIWYHIFKTVLKVLHIYILK